MVIHDDELDAQLTRARGGRKTRDPAVHCDKYPNTGSMGFFDRSDIEAIAIFEAIGLARIPSKA